MSKAILIQAEDWEGLFVDGTLVDEGHTLNEGMSRVKYFIKLAKHHNFDLDELKEVYIDERDEEKLNDIGCFPVSLYDLVGDYENMESNE